MMKKKKTKKMKREDDEEEATMMMHVQVDEDVVFGQVVAVVDVVVVAAAVNEVNWAEGDVAVAVDETVVVFVVVARGAAVDVQRHWLPHITEVRICYAYKITISMAKRTSGHLYIKLYINTNLVCSPVRF